MGEEIALSLTPRFIAVGAISTVSSLRFVRRADAFDTGADRKTVETVMEFALSFVTAIHRGVNEKVALKAFNLFIHTHTAMTRQRMFILIFRAGGFVKKTTARFALHLSRQANLQAPD
jgi:hypothetical protein